MKCRVVVTLKKSVFDPQGSAIERSLKTIGVESVETVRQGKIFDITLRNGISREEAEAEMRRVAQDVLTNPIIEECHVEFL